MVSTCVCKGYCLWYRGAYTQETRDVILSLDRANKTAPNGKQILKNVGVAMYLGAKIGFLGQNGESSIIIMCPSSHHQLQTLLHMCMHGHKAPVLAIPGYHMACLRTQHNHMACLRTKCDLPYTVRATIHMLCCSSGAGKSSLMRILAGQDQEYEGTMQLSPGIKVGYLQQEPVLDMNSTVLENIAPALAPTKAMLTEFEEVGPSLHGSRHLFGTASVVVCLRIQLQSQLVVEHNIFSSPLSMYNVCHCFLSG